MRSFCIPFYDLIDIKIDEKTQKRSENPITYKPFLSIENFQTPIFLNTDQSLIQITNDAQIVKMDFKNIKREDKIKLFEPLAKGRTMDMFQIRTNQIPLKDRLKLREEKFEREERKREREREESRQESMKRRSKFSVPHRTQEEEDFLNMSQQDYSTYIR